MSDYKKRARQVLKRINALAAISEDDTALTRTFGSEAFVEASRKVAMWMLEAGLNTHIDSIGNVRGKLLSNNSEAKTFVIASHIDTVVNAGKFDGPLGVLAGLNLLEALINSGKEIPFHIELIAFSDEEGVRFHTTYLGSKVVTGSFEPSLFDCIDKDGIRLKEVLNTIGSSSLSQIKKDAIPAQDWLGYFEIHIEQGPVLDDRNIPIGVVNGIAGQKRITVEFEGFAGHAGTVPMNMRQDALCCAAEFILAIETYALAHKDRFVATVGKLDVFDSASNVIPGKVTCSVDLRSSDSEFLTAAAKHVEETLHLIAAKRNIRAYWKLIQNTQPISCDKNLKQLLIRSIEKPNYPLVELTSGAGHDAVQVANVSPVCMLFVRCDKGISHNPLENTNEDDIAAALEVSEDFINTLITLNPKTEWKFQH